MIERVKQIPKQIAIRIIAILILLLPSVCFAKSYYGVNLSLPVVTKEPDSLHGYQVMLTYDPQRFKWRKFNISFDGGFTRYWSNSMPYYSTVNIYSAAPVIHYNFRRHGAIQPYLEISIGLAYLNHTHLERRNLGMHFAFQDRMGLGMFIGYTDQVSVGLHAVHYSNAHLCGNNSGITVPLELDMGVRFG